MSRFPTIIDHTPQFLAMAENEIERAIARAAIRVQATAKDLTSRFSGPTKTNPTAPASSTGEPPHLRTGTLNRSIEQETFREGPDFVGRVGTNLKYGFWLEFGTSRMDQRPYLRPSLDANRSQISEEIRAAGRRMK